MGLKVNASNTSFILGRKNYDGIASIKAITRFSLQPLPFNYAGYPIYKERVSRRTFLLVIGNMRKILQGWQGKFLSTRAKLTVTKSVLIALPIYFIFILDPPKTTILEPPKIISNFFGMA